MKTTLASPNNNWDIDNDILGVANGALTNFSLGFANAFAGDPSWTDYTLEADIRIIELGQYGSLRIFFRHDIVWNGYGIAFAADRSVVHRFDGNWDKNTVLVPGNDLILEQGKPYHVRIDVKGNTFTFYINGEKVFEAVDPDNEYPTGCCSM